METTRGNPAVQSFSLTQAARSQAMANRPRKEIPSKRKSNPAPVAQAEWNSHHHPRAVSMAESPPERS
jgi:hypothetical protein